ncbi:DUF6119 family protein [Spirochaeta cellobiosiphila]|uniref:DUF6119 family protein n=1 Tax=Spirochaeta cellobiosiphila TaxID=504483 RepID=UPI0012EBB34B
MFVFTNGYSLCIIDTNKIEWGFGIKIALNILSGNEIRGVDVKLKNIEKRLMNL